MEPVTPPDATLTVGDTVRVPTKSAFKSTSVYGLLMLLLSAAVTKWVRPEFQEQGRAAAVEALDWMIPILFTAGAALVAWGRARAAQPLHLLGPSRTEVTIKALAPILLLLPLAGCVTNKGQPISRAAQLHLARQTHTSAANIASSLIEQGVITDQGTKDVIFYASREVLDGTNAAEAKLGTGDNVGFDFIMARVQSALDRLAAINAQHKRSDAGPRSDAWIPSRSRPSSSPPRPRYESWSKPGNVLTEARSRPPTMRPQLSQLRLQPTHV